MRQRYFITSTGTGIGKTFITAGLVRQARALQKSVAAYKPIISGFDPRHPEESDTGVLLQSLNRPPEPQIIDEISPWRFSSALAPSMAAHMEKIELSMESVVAHGKKAIEGKEDIVLIEGVGGVMVPLDDKHLVIDWIEALSIEVILVTGSYLGTLSHTLTALSVLQQRHIPIFAIVVNESPESTVPLEATLGELSRRTRLPIISVAWRPEPVEDEDLKELKPLLTVST